MKVILASGSPRRKQLLEQMGLEFDVVPSKYVEVLDENSSPIDVAKKLALGKAKEVAASYPKCLVIGSDTLVWVNNKQLGKPATEQEAIDMLKFLANKDSKVTTSVAIVKASDNIEVVKTDTTTVSFKPYNAAAIAKYVATGDYVDKAGAYGIQSGAAELISHIVGNYDTVVGLPTKLLADMLKDFGVVASPVNLQPPVKQK